MIYIFACSSLHHIAGGIRRCRYFMGGFCTLFMNLWFIMKKNRLKGGRGVAKGYRTGSVSKMLGLSREALRFYEKRRVLMPKETDVQNGYRYYQREDMAHLFKVKYYQSLGFTLSDIRSDFWDLTLAQWQQALRAQRAEKQAEIEQIQSWLHVTEQRLDALSDLCQPGEFRLQTRPAMLYFRHTDAAGNLVDTDAMHAQTHRWVQAFPMAQYAFRCPPERLDTLEATDSAHMLAWGFCIRPEDAARCALPQSEAVSYLPACLCARVMLNLNTHIPMDLRALGPLVQSICRTGLHINGDILGMWHATVKQGNGHAKYYEVFVPVQTNG